MLLVSLPPKLLLRIFSLVGAEFFRQDIRRLTISRRWYDFAWPALVEHLSLPTARSVVAFSASTDLLQRTKRYITSLSLTLNYPGSSSDIDDTAVAKLEEWLAEVRVSFAHLTAALRDSPRLRTLSIQVAIFHLPKNPLREQYVKALVTRHQTSLQPVDAAGSSPSPGGEDASTHPGPCFCRSIKTLLPQLRKLHCQMDFVCPLLLAAPEDNSTLLDLDEVIVKLSRRAAPAVPRVGLYASHCQPTTIVNVRFTRDMEAEATILASRLRDPKVVRIVTWENQGYLSFDALEQRHIGLEPGTEWNVHAECWRDPRGIGSFVMPGTT